MTKPKTARNADIVARVFSAGESIESVALLYGVTTRRIQQILGGHAPVRDPDTVKDAATNVLINNHIMKLQGHLGGASNEVQQISRLRARLSSSVATEAVDRRLADIHSRPLSKQ